jgi:hypothetical protein
LVNNSSGRHIPGTLPYGSKNLLTTDRLGWIEIETDGEGLWVKEAAASKIDGSSRFLVYLVRMIGAAKTDLRKTMPELPFVFQCLERLPSFNMRKSSRAFQEWRYLMASRACSRSALVYVELWAPMLWSASTNL